MSRPRSLVLAFLAVLFAAGLAGAHQERMVQNPARPGPVPNVARINSNSLVVCKPSSKPTPAELADIELRLATETGDDLLQAQRDLAAWYRNSDLFERCCFEHIQDAIDAAGNNTDILILPGVYREEPSRAFPETSTGDNPDGSYSYEYHVANPHDANLIAVMGKENVTLEGTGGKPEDVLVDAGFAKDVGVRCDRCKGIIYRNFWVRDANEHGVYTIDSDGYVYDRMVGSFSSSYQLFAFASDNGIMEDSEAYGGSDSGFYIGASANTPGRFSAYFRRNYAHHNALGYSGTNGNYVLFEDNEITDNCIGWTSDAEPTAHANFPQNHSQFIGNDVHHNNFDIYAPTSDVPPGGPGYGFLHYPCGSGTLLAGGNDNLYSDNHFYGHNRYGTLLIANGAALEGFNGSNNQYRNNIMGMNLLGMPDPNGTADFWWDEWGTNNCWQDNGAVTSDPAALPNCSLPNVGVGNPSKSLLLASCLITDTETGQTAGACPWGTSNQAPYENRDQQECHNAMIDLGEDCDRGYGPWPPDLNGETCESLGHGGGTLACDDYCVYDLAGCDIPGACRSYAIKRLKVSRLAAPAGDEILTIKGRTVDGSGATFNPLTESASIVLRDQTGTVHTAVIPAGNANWRARPATGIPTKYIYKDRAGTFGGVTKIVLKQLASPIQSRVTIKVRGVNLSGASDARSATATFRVGDDCWQEEAPCELRGRGTRVLCASTTNVCS